MSSVPDISTVVRTEQEEVGGQTHCPTVFLDRDGVLNKKATLARYVRTWEEFEWLPGAREALRLFAEAGYRVIVISNQAGIARGVMTEQDVRIIHDRMREEAAAAGGRIDAVYYCPHGWDDGCLCRKPKPGLLLQAQRDFSLDLSQVTFIGDDERDGQASATAGTRWVQVTDSMSLLEIAQHLVAEQAVPLGEVDKSAVGLAIDTPGSSRQPSAAADPEPSRQRDP